MPIHFRFFVPQVPNPDSHSGIAPRRRSETKRRAAQRAGAAALAMDPAEGDLDPAREVEMEPALVAALSRCARSPRRASGQGALRWPPEATNYPTLGPAWAGGAGALRLSSALAPLRKCTEAEAPLQERQGGLADCARRNMQFEPHPGRTGAPAGRPVCSGGWMEWLKRCECFVTGTTARRSD